MKKLLLLLLLSLSFTGLASHVYDDIPSDGTAIWEYKPISGSDCRPYYSNSVLKNYCSYAHWLLPSNAYASGYSWKCYAPYEKDKYGDTDYSYRCIIKSEEEKIADAKVAEEKRIADAKKAEAKRIADAKKAEAKRIADAKEAEERRLRLQNYPGFKDLKPGLIYDEVLKFCPLKLSGNPKSGTSAWRRCYGINNIKFEATYQSNFLKELTIDMGPIVETGGYLGIFGEGDSNIFIKMKKTFDSKYTLDYEYSERDRQLFNESEKSRLYLVYSKGQVVLEISRKEKDWYSDLWLYIHYLDAAKSERFLEENRPVRASADDF